MLSKLFSNSRVKLICSVDNVHFSFHANRQRKFNFVYISAPTFARYMTELKYAKDRLNLFKRNENEAVIQGLVSILKSLTEN
jgi:hypothetical protein